MMELTNEQNDFLNSQGCVVLCACPGSGKTYITAQKFLAFHDSWTYHQQGIALLSFTNVAKMEIESQARGLRNGIFKIEHPHFIGTIDSFINTYILLRFGYLALGGKRPRMLRKELSSLPFRFWRSECFRSGCVANFHDFQILGDGKLYKNGERIECEGKNGYGPPCIEYKKRLLKSGIVFQSEAAGLALCILNKHPLIAKSLARRFPVIIVDEAQDTSREQVQIFDILNSHKLKSIFFVGDPDQSIYEWRNANPECFVEKINDSEWENKYLTYNFRSSQLICNAVNEFSNTYNCKSPNIASGQYKSHHQKPLLLIFDKNTTSVEHVILKFLEISCKNGIETTPSNVAVVTRAKINNETDIRELWKSSECELFALSCYEFKYGTRREALAICEKALYGVTIDNMNSIFDKIENHVNNKFDYTEWKNLALEILISMPSPQTKIGLWVSELLRILSLLLEKHGIACREGVQLSNLIKIKSRDSNFPNFKDTPLLNFFETKRQGKFTLSSVHGVKGEAYESLLLIVSQKGKTLTQKFLSEGELNSELMRIAYVAMTRPRKLLAIAMPCGKTKKVFPRFPIDKWEYFYL